MLSASTITAQAKPKQHAPKHHKVKHTVKLSASEVWAKTPFATCVRWRESRDGQSALNLYEIEGPNRSGNYGDYEWLNGTSRIKQNEIAYQMYLSRNDQPWRPYDGCYSGMYYPHKGY